MARPQSIGEEQLIERLSCVFRDVGFEGASLAMLSRATGLQKASLYHRFPGGKEQMAREVLSAAFAWLETHIVAPLRGDGSPRQRLAAVTGQLDRFYAGGRQSCLLNMLSSPQTQKGAFAGEIRAAFNLIIEALAAVAREAGLDKAAARLRSERAVVLLQGSLVLARGLGTTRPFKAVLQGLPEELLAGAAAR